MVVTQKITLDTTGNCDIQNITSHVTRAITASELTAGIDTVFCPGATGGVTTIEYESGLLGDIRQMLDEIIPANRDYLHGLRSGEDNGHSHLRATLVGPSLTIPFSDGRLILGKWQQIVFLDFDTRPRSRSIIAQIIGE